MITANFFEEFILESSKNTIAFSRIFVIIQSMGSLRFLHIIHEKERFVQRQMENTREFMIHLGSVRDVEDFVRISTAQPYPVFLDDGCHRVNGKSFMEMFCLVLTRPLRVTLQCSDQQLNDFSSLTARFQIN